MGNTPIRFGLVGMGKWGGNYIRTIKDLEGIKLQRVCCQTSINKKLDLEDIYVHLDWKDLLNSNDIDGVIIASPPDKHFEMAKLCLERRLPLIVEKPLTTNHIEAKELLNLARESSSIVFVDHIHLYHSAFRTLKTLELTRRFNRRVSLQSLVFSLSYSPFY